MKVAGIFAFQMNRLGIIAGNGDLAARVIADAAQHHDIYVASLNGDAQAYPRHIAQNFELGQIGSLLDFFKRNDVKDISFIGAIPRPNIMNLNLDTKGKEWITKLGLALFKGDDALLKKIIELVELEGFNVIDSVELFQDLPHSFETSMKPTALQQRDIDTASALLVALSPYDIGQSVIMEDGIVLGIEAAEGTDHLIKRCALLRKATAPSGVLIKRAKSGQSLKVDRPTIGPKTFENIKNAGLAGLAFAPDECHILDANQCTEYANQHGLFIATLT